VGKLDYAGAALRMTLDSHVQVMRLGSCAKEPETVAWIERCLRTEDTLFDVGANVGAYSLIAGARGARVVAVEPSPTTFAALCRNIALNAFEDRITPVQCALGPRTELVRFGLASLDPGAADHDGLSGGARALTVPCFRLDELQERFGLPEPNHLKVDVDGAEAAVLAGATMLLSNDKLRSILVEIDETEPASRGVSALLTEFGFRITGRHERLWKGQFNTVFER
jgi:FkbM family methyltransferase